MQHTLTHIVMTSVVGSERAEWIGIESIEIWLTSLTINRDSDIKQLLPTCARKVTSDVLQGPRYFKCECTCVRMCVLCMCAKNEVSDVTV